jgi:hypothetical protein
MTLNNNEFIPSDERSSLLVRLSSGCCGGRCAFCDERRTGFRLMMRPVCSSAMGTEVKAFIRGEDCIGLPAEWLLDAMSQVIWRHPEIASFSAEAKTQALLMKSLAEMCMLRSAGLTRIYHYVFTDSAALLQEAITGETLAEQRAAAKLIHESGIELVQVFVAGLEVSLDDAVRQLECMRPHKILVAGEMGTEVFRQGYWQMNSLLATYGIDVEIDSTPSMYSGSALSSRYSSRLSATRVTQQ